MADHSELMTEMPYVEKMSTQERLKHAKKRRLQQLKKYSQREKEYNSKKKKTDLNMNKKSKRVEYKVHFVSSVMLLEAASRSDINEGTSIRDKNAQACFLLLLFSISVKANNK